jgi:hypothetical protein
MAKGANGTIDLASFEQLRVQRLSTSARNLEHSGGKSFGIATDRLDSIFTSSPLLSSNRVADIEGSRDPDGIQVSDGDIYKMYANVVDGDNSINGFGFYGTDTVDLNYKHLKNPFYIQSTDSIDFSLLTTGAMQTDSAGNITHYAGSPDLIPNNLNSPETEIGNTTPIFETSDSTNIPHRRENLFGSTDASYASIVDNEQGLGFSGNPDTVDTIGKYFNTKFNV